MWHRGVNPGGLQGAPKTNLGATSLPLTWYSLSPVATMGCGPGPACSGSERTRRKMGRLANQGKAFLLGQENNSQGLFQCLLTCSLPCLDRKNIVRIEQHKPKVCTAAYMLDVNPYLFSTLSG